VHPQHEVDEALRLVAEGLNDCQIARVTGISRTTIREWRRYGPPGRRAGRRTSVCPRCDGRPLDEPAYAYLLGLYLGDGHISKIRNVYRLQIFQDERYVFLIALAGEAILRVRAGHGKVSNVPQMGCDAVSAYWRHWPCVFPQHGPGLKHRRPIELASWQVRLVSAYPRQLVRGLVHSDGCRVMNRVWKGKYAYPRYFFTNMSEDILQIFRVACDQIGVAHRNSKPNTISVARRADVAALDRFIGPKS
jgi:Homeodomain-like domain